MESLKNAFAGANEKLKGLVGSKPDCSCPDVSTCNCAAKNGFSNMSTTPSTSSSYHNPIYGSAPLYGSSTAVYGTRPIYGSSTVTEAPKYQPESTSFYDNSNENNYGPGPIYNPTTNPPLYGAPISAIGQAPAWTSDGGRRRHRKSRRFKKSRKSRKSRRSRKNKRR